MPEGEQNMPGPEQGPTTEPEQEFGLARTINLLLERRVNEQGEEERGSAEIEDKRLRLLAIKAKTPGLDLTDIATEVAGYLEDRLNLFEKGQLVEKDYEKVEREALLLQNILIEEHEKTTADVDEKQTDNSSKGAITGEEERGEG
ncbi:MAG: hypothetical protein XD98_0217, partial [Microgenomates bacterium 39_6]